MGRLCGIVAHMTISADMMWAIGLFEGEGCISLKKRAKPFWKPHVQLELTSTDLDVLNRFTSIVGFGAIQPRAKVAGCKQAWVWRGCKAHENAELLTLWVPQLGERRRGKALMALAVYYRPYKKREKRAA